MRALAGKAGMRRATGEVVPVDSWLQPLTTLVVRNAIDHVGVLVAVTREATNRIQEPPPRHLSYRPQ